MKENTSNRKYQDTLFRTIFGREEHKPWLLELYNALNDSNYQNLNDLTLTTIENVVYIKMKNDVSFLLDSRMNLFEHQSSYNPNMPLRGFFYFAKLYQDYITTNDISIYNSTLKKIPTPEYIVFYTGDDKKLDFITELKLTDAFEIPRKDKNYEWTCKVINLTSEKGKELNKKCKSLYDYCSFIAKVKQNRKDGMTLGEAINQAVDWAIEENLLDGLFKRERSQIMGDILTEFDEELFLRTNFQDGKEEGAHENALKNARNLLKMNLLTLEQIAQATELPLQEVLRLQNEL